MQGDIRESEKASPGKQLPWAGEGDGNHLAKGWMAPEKMFWGRKGLGPEETKKDWREWHLDSEGGATQEEMARQAGVTLCMALAGHNEGLKQASHLNFWRDFCGCLTEVREIISKPPSSAEHILRQVRQAQVWHCRGVPSHCLAVVRSPSHCPSGKLCAIVDSAWDTESRAWIKVQALLFTAVRPLKSCLTTLGFSTHRPGMA